MTDDVNVVVSGDSAYVVEVASPAAVTVQVPTGPKGDPGGVASVNGKTGAVDLGTTYVASPATTDTGALLRTDDGPVWDTTATRAARSAASGLQAVLNALRTKLRATSVTRPGVTPTAEVGGVSPRLSGASSVLELDDGGTWTIGGPAATDLTSSLPNKLSALTLDATVSAIRGVGGRATLTHSTGAQYNVISTAYRPFSEEMLGADGSMPTKVTGDSAISATAWNKLCVESGGDGTSGVRPWRLLRTTRLVIDSDLVAGSYSFKVKDVDYDKTFWDTARTANPAVPAMPKMRPSTATNAGAGDSRGVGRAWLQAGMNPDDAHESTPDQWQKVIVLSIVPDDASTISAAFPFGRGPGTVTIDRPIKTSVTKASMNWSFPVRGLGGANTYTFKADGVLNQPNFALTFSDPDLEVRHASVTGVDIVCNAADSNGILVNGADTFYAKDITVTNPGGSAITYAYSGPGAVENFSLDGSSNAAQFAQWVHATSASLKVNGGYARGFAGQAVQAETGADVQVTGSLIDNTLQNRSKSAPIVAANGGAHVRMDDITVTGNPLLLATLSGQGTEVLFGGSFKYLCNGIPLLRPAHLNPVTCRPRIKGLSPDGVTPYDWSGSRLLTATRRVQITPNMSTAQIAALLPNGLVRDIEASIYRPDSQTVTGQGITDVRLVTTTPAGGPATTPVSLLGTKMPVPFGTAGDNKINSATQITANRDIGSAIVWPDQGYVALITDIGTNPATQYITMSGATGGTWTYTNAGNTTSAIAYAATPATVQTAVRALPGLSTTTVVSGPAANSYILTLPTGTVLGSVTSSLTGSAPVLAVRAAAQWTVDTALPVDLSTATAPNSVTYGGLLPLNGQTGISPETFCRLGAGTNAATHGYFWNAWNLVPGSSVTINVGTDATATGAEWLFLRFSYFPTYETPNGLAAASNANVPITQERNDNFPLSGLPITSRGTWTANTYYSPWDAVVKNGLTWLRRSAGVSATTFVDDWSAGKWMPMSAPFVASPVSGKVLLPDYITTLATGTPVSGTTVVTPFEVGPDGLNVSALTMNQTTAQVGGATTFTAAIWANDDAVSGLYTPQWSAGPRLAPVTFDLTTAAGNKTAAYALTLAPGTHHVVSQYLATTAPTTAPVLTTVGGARAGRLPSNAVWSAVFRFMQATGQAAYPTTGITGSYTGNSNATGPVIGVVAA